MEYNKIYICKDGRECLLRNGVETDGEEVMEIFNKTHGETDFLLSYPDENSMNAKEEGEFLAAQTKNPRAIEILAIVEGRIVGLAGFSPVGHKYKVKHRATFGISVLQEYWGLGIGKALMMGCIECAREAEITQLELDVVADNEKAIRMYQSAGFTEFGRNPKGFYSRFCGDQELVYMRLEL